MLTETFDRLLRAEIEVWNSVDARLQADVGLPAGRARILQAMGRHSPCRVQDVADDVQVTVGGTSKLVDRLEAAGLCRRLPNPTDRRSSLLELTDEGVRTVTRIEAATEAALAESLGSLSTADRETLHRLLGQVLR